MYNIYLVQCGMLFGDNEHPSAFLPYATGCLAAYAWNKPSVREQYDLKKILYKEEDIDSIVNELEDPFLVGFSCSVWNYAYNRSLAEKIKQQYPDCHILFGGHEITHDFEVLKKYPYVDFTIFGEGELAFSRLLEELAGTMDLTSVPSLCYRDQGQYKMTEIQAEEAENLVSPYLTGLFDSMLAENMEFMATIETVRGCPFNCAFCDGSMEGNVVRIFPLQRILDEIQWVSDHQFNVLFFADSNFGMSRRDVEIASWIAEKKALTGYPRKWDGALSKEKNDSAIRTAEILHEANMFHIVTLSVQSTDNAVLRAIGRKNLDFDAFHESIEAYVSNGIQPFTELILGLPEETYDSFCEGFEKLILAGQKYYVEVYRCYILPNALLGRPETVERYGIKTVFTPPVMHHIPLEDANHMQPSARIVVETASMSNSEWVRANLFAVLVQALYYMGTLKRVADHLHDTKGVSYRSLFEGILQWGLCHPERFTGTILKKLSEIFQNFSEGTGHLHYYNPAFGDIVWFVEEGLFLEIAAHTQAFYEDMIDYLKESRFDDDLCEEMLRYQLFMLYAPQRKKFSAEFHYDFRESVPKPQNILVTVDQNICYDSLADYAREVVWFKRKSGGTICSENNCSIRYEVQ